jgi:hypothetical protein
MSVDSSNAVAISNSIGTTCFSVDTSGGGEVVSISGDNAPYKLLVQDGSSAVCLKCDTTSNTTTVQNLVVLGTIAIPLTYASPLYGDGSDGDVVLFSGSSTLSRDMFYRNLTLTTYTLSTNGFRIFVQGTLTFNDVDSIIRNNGADGPVSNGAGAPTNTVGGGGAGGVSGTTITGIGGYGGGNSIMRLSAGEGWNGSTMNCFHALPCITTGRTMSGAIVLGGSGGFGYAANGGGGGVVVVCASVVTGAAGVISAQGGDGLVGSGGGGGFILVATSTAFDTDAIRLATAGGSGITDGNGGQSLVIVNGQPALSSLTEAPLERALVVPEEPASVPEPELLPLPLPTAPEEDWVLASTME